MPNENKKTIDLTGIDDFSYSAIMRKLRDHGEAASKFQKIFKSYFDAQVLNGEITDKKIHAILIKTFKMFGALYPVKINSKVLKNASKKTTIPLFSKVTDTLFRGGAPEVKDVLALKKLGINKIVSLDLDSGNKINKICKMLHIKHVMLPLSQGNVNKLLKLDLKKLFADGPTFVHCKHGKDRTGLVIALFRIAQGQSRESALREAYKLGFTSSLSPDAKEKFLNVIRGKSKDANDAMDIVHNLDLENSIINPGQAVNNSFAPLVYDFAEEYPWGGVNSSENTRLQLGKSDDNNQQQSKINPGFNPEAYDNIVYNNKDPVAITSGLPQAGFYEAYTGGAGPIGINTGPGIGVSASAERNIILKKSHQVQLTYNISDQEKMHAEQALKAFEFLMTEIEQFNSHLNLMYIPFSENQDITPEQIWKFRPTFRDYRDKAKENLQELQKIAFRCINLMNHFMSDTQVEKIIKSFNVCIDDVTKQFDAFIILFKNLQSKTFKEDVVKTIMAIKKETAQLKQIIEERIQNLLEKDILSKSWVDRAGNLNIKVDPKVPQNLSLFNKQLDRLNKPE